jgi:hypothetical protein
MGAEPVRRLVLSVVSHGQGQLVKTLLDDLAQWTSRRFGVVLTVNIPETLPFSPEDYPFTVVVLRNQKRQGFGANHNLAFRTLPSELFCVLNPDIRLAGDPFADLAAALRTPEVAAAAPRLLSVTGMREDNARRFPTPLSIACKALGMRADPSPRGAAENGGQPDWIGGMFMLFRSEAFARVGGFDQRYFLYYEDVDLCARLRLLGLSVVLCEQVAAIHDARRDSHRRPRYFMWHLSSMLRFFLSTPFLRLTMRRWLGTGRAVR